MFATIGKSILKYADKQLKKKVYKVGNKRTSYKNKYDPKTNKLVKDMTKNELYNYKRYDFKGLPIKGHKFNKKQEKFFGDTLTYSSINHSKLPKYMKG